MDSTLPTARCDSFLNSTCCRDCTDLPQQAGAFPLSCSLFSVCRVWHSEMVQCWLAPPHAGEDASHISEAGDNARHWVFGMDLVLQIDEAFVLRDEKGFEHLAHWHDAVSHRNLTFFTLEVREV